MGKRFSIVVSLIALLILVASSAIASDSSGSTYVPLDSWVYSAIERAASMGALPQPFMGQRPWTREACAQLLEKARENPSAYTQIPEAQRIVRELEMEFAPELHEADGDSGGVRVESAYTRLTGIAGSPLRDGYHTAQTIVNDYGRPYGEGANDITGVSARAESGHFFLHFRGEFQHSADGLQYSAATLSVFDKLDQFSNHPIKALVPDNSGQDRFTLLDTYAGVNVKGWEFTFGKQSLWWGPDAGASFLYSNNAEPMYMGRLDRTVPAMLPWIFKYLGPMRMNLFFGKMQGHLYPARPFLHGEKVSFQPTPNLEFGFSRTTIFSGVGRPLTWKLLAKTYFSVGDNPYDYLPQNDPGDRRGGFDFRYRVPYLRNWLTFYCDSLTDDDPSPLAAPNRAAWNPGLYLSHVPGIPNLDLRVEGGYTNLPTETNRHGQLFYWNGNYPDGYTERGMLIGNWIGRDGTSLEVSTSYWFSALNRVQLTYRRHRVSDDFLPLGGKDDTVGGQVDWRLKDSVSLSAFAQYQRWNYPVMGAPQNVGVAGFTLAFEPIGGKKIHSLKAW